MQDSCEKLFELCSGSPRLRSIDSELVRNRLKSEIKEIDSQAECDYFLELHEKGLKFAKNENNLLVAHLIGLCEDFDISSEPRFVQGEFPDIDVDYLPVIQEYLRNDWCPRTFGREKVVNIGNYGTFGIKSALLDMARVHGADYQEIQAITKNLQDKDEEGKPLTWDKALEAAPELSSYCERNPEIADSARRLIDRNRGRGKHAGGTVVSNINIADLVPVMIDTDGNPVSGWTEGLHDQDLQPVGLIKFDVLAVKDLLRIAHCCHLVKTRHPEVSGISAASDGSDWSDTDGNPVSGWTEGLHDQDLQPVGLIKFDVLAVKDLLRIAHCCHLVKTRHPEVSGISAASGGSDWSDTSYLNDAKSLELANRAETRGIFQFDGEGMRKLIKAGGVTRFEDLVAYSSLFRPGPLGMKMHERYVERKKGREKWRDQMPECIRDSLATTYNVLCYQEQVMKILNILGDIPLIHCEKIRKAISKKKTSEFIKYKQMFLENGSKKTGWPIESKDERNMNRLWSLIESFASYGFNRSHAVAYTVTSARLLYLKAHYPIEFFCSTLALEGDEDKVKIYKREAERQGIKVNRCDLNKSGVNYEIVDDEIYVGFSNIKGIGEDAAKRIVSLKPFSGVEDFLARFGTDKRIVEPLVHLGVFKDCEPWVAWEFYEEYKKWSKGNQDKEKRQMKRRSELMESVKSMISSSEPVDHESIMRMAESGLVSYRLSPEFSADDLMRIVKKYAKSVLDFEHKENFSRSNPISLENWKPSGKYAKDWSNVFEIERRHYGFSWNHPIQKSNDYLGGHSFGLFKEDESIVTAGIEVMVVKRPQEKVSKNGNKYYYVLVEDEDWNVEVVTFWSEDYARFKDDLNYWNESQGRGHFLRMRVTKPGSGFKSYTFDSPPKRIRYKVVPPDKKDDVRLQIMHSPM